MIADNQYRDRWFQFTCPNCNNQISYGWTKCLECGHRIIGFELPVWLDRIVMFLIEAIIVLVVFVIISLVANRIAPGVPIVVRLLIAIVLVRFKLGFKREQWRLFVAGPVTLRIQLRREHTSYQDSSAIPPTFKCSIPADQYRKPSEQAGSMSFKLSHLSSDERKSLVSYLKECAPSVLMVVISSDSSISPQAFEVAGQLSTDQLQSFLMSEDSHVRRGALRELLYLHKRKEDLGVYRPALVKMMDTDDSPDCLEIGVQLLAGTSDKKELLVLQRLAKGGPSVSVRQEAITSLAQVPADALATEETIPVLLECLRDSDREIRLRASEALAWLAKCDHGENADEWEKWWLDSRRKTDA